MKTLTLFCLILFALPVFAGEKEQPGGTKAPKGHWEKITVKGQRTNVTEPGQTKVIALKCSGQLNVECLHYYVWVPENMPSGNPCGTTVVYNEPPHSIPMVENNVYVGYYTEQGEVVYEQSTISTECVAGDGSTDVSISPGINP